MLVLFFTEGSRKQCAHDSFISIIKKKKSERKREIEAGSGRVSSNGGGGLGSCGGCGLVGSTVALPVCFSSLYKCLSMLE